MFYGSVIDQYYKISLNFGKIFFITTYHFYWTLWTKKFALEKRSKSTLINVDSQSEDRKILSYIEHTNIRAYTLQSKFKFRFLP